MSWWIGAVAALSGTVASLPGLCNSRHERILPDPGLKQGLEAHVTMDGRIRQMRDPLAHTELVCGLHPLGNPRQCADRSAATSDRTGISRFALLMEGTGDLAATEENVRRLGAEVLSHLRLSGPAESSAGVAELAAPVLKAPPAYRATSIGLLSTSPRTPVTG